MLLTKVKRPALVLFLLLLVAGMGLWSWCAPSALPAPPHTPAVAAAAVQGPAPQPDPVQVAADRMQSVNNLKVLGLAMWSYYEGPGKLPPAAVRDKDNKPLLSWRVLLLPHLGERDLFKQFKLDEAWDSAHNKNLLERMPKVYAPVGVKTKEPHTTYYQGFTGPGTAFDGPRGLRIQDFRLFSDRIHCSFVDGSVQTLKRDFHEPTMRLVIIRNDDRPVNARDLFLQDY
jgi:hypothetical protein